MSLKNKLFIFVIALLVIDQAAKIWIKTHFMIGDEFNVLGDWFKIHFIENNGMAFGMASESGKTGKTILSLFRIVAVVGIAWYTLKLLKEKAPVGVIFSFGMIFCGALGNIIDSMFYGLIFNDSYSQVATFLPESGGYAPFLHGRVVDMLYFPIYEDFLPSWIPIWGGDYLVFFRPVFNLADSYITIGVLILILFHRKFFSGKNNKKNEVKTDKSNTAKA